jgi:hypothetical protein
MEGFHIAAIAQGVHRVLKRDANHGTGTPNPLFAPIGSE